MTLCLPSSSRASRLSVPSFSLAVARTNGGMQNRKEKTGVRVDTGF